MDFDDPSRRYKRCSQELWDMMGHQLPSFSSAFGDALAQNVVPPVMRPPISKSRLD
jgi:hypothetical protein